MKKHKAVAVLLLIAMVFSWFSFMPEVANAASDPRDINPPAGAQITVNNRPYFSAGFWAIYVDGKRVGDSLAVAEDYWKGEFGDTINMLHQSTLSSWANTFTPFPSPTGYYEGATFSKKLNWRPEIQILNYNGRNSPRMHIRELADQLGVQVSYNSGKKEVYVTTSKFPTGAITYPSGLREGDRITFQIRGTAYSSVIEEYRFFVENVRVKSGKPNKNTFSDSVSYILSAGQQELRLEITDSIGRITTYRQYISPAGKPVPPPEPPKPEPPVGWPVADFTMPSTAADWDPVRIKNTSKPPKGGRLVDAQWEVSTKLYEGELGFDGGTIYFERPNRTYDVTLTVTDNNGNTDSITKSIFITEWVPPDDGDEPEPEPEPKSQPPWADFELPEEVFVGETVEVINTSSDPDGEIVENKWSIDRGDKIEDVWDSLANGEEPPLGWKIPTDANGTIGNDGGTIVFSEEGIYTVTLKVIDNDGLWDLRPKTIVVLSANPKAYFSWKGVPKENRKIELDATGSFTPDIYPIDWSKTEWEIVPPEGVSSDSIKIVTSTDLSRRTLLFKDAGDYTVRLRVTNAGGLISEWYEETLKIYPDEPPVADFFVMETVTRDPAKGNKARIELNDLSYSPDGDIISKRVWQYRYDSNNDGSFVDEAWQVLDDGNNPSPVLLTDQVGKYEFSLEIEEEFGQETIPQFISAADKQVANTADKALEERMTEVINIRPVVGFSPITKKKVDIVFTIGDVLPSKLDGLVNKIATQLETRLNDALIDYGTIKFIEVANISTETQNARTIFQEWESFEIGNPYSSNVGGFTITADNALRSNGNYRPARGFWNPGLAARQIRNADIQFTWGISENTREFMHGEAGFMFRMQDKNNYYAYIMDNHNACGNVLFNDTEALVKVVNGNFQVLATSSFPSYYAGQQHKIRIKVEGDNIKVWRDGILTFDVNDSSYMTGSYGFYVWDQKGSYFKDISVPIANIYSLSDVLKEPNWRNGALRFLVDISDSIYQEFEDQATAALIFSQLFNDNIYFSVLGTTLNRDQAISIIERNDSKGIFVDNNDMDAALVQIADYIISQIQQHHVETTQYVLIDDEIVYETYYSDRENDPEISRRWLYKHNPSYFDNSMGQAPFHNQHIPLPATRLSQVGEYEVEFQVRDNPKNDNRFDKYRLWSYMPLDKLTLYVHRRPVAEFSFTLTQSQSNYNISFQNHSYDLDHQFSRLDKGIVSEEWQWKEVSETTWTAGKPTYLQKGKEYLVSLRVLDPEGVWSDPDVKVISAGTALPPVARFTVNPNPLPLGDVLSCEDLSYDPNGYPLTEWAWRYRKDNGPWINTGSSFPSNVYGSLGTYEIELRVKNSQNRWSEPYYQTVEVIAQNRPPVARFTVSPNPLPLDVLLTYKDESYDPDGDPIVAREWQYQKSGGPWIDGQPLDFNTPGFGIGDYTIRLRVKDQPALAQLTPLWSEWYSQNLKVIPGNEPPVARFTLSPNPVAADEPVTYLDTSYDPEGLSLVERVWQVRKQDGTVLAEYRNQLPPRIFESTGWGDDGDGVGTYVIALRVKDQSPNGISPAKWSEWYTQTFIVEEPLRVIGDTDKNTYMAGQALLLNAFTEGRACKVESTVWFKNKHTNTDVTELIPERFLGDPPEKQMEWRTRRYKDDPGGRDLVVIIPPDMPDGIYQVEFTAYKESADGTIKTAHDTITVRVEGVVYDRSYSEIIGGPR